MDKKAKIASISALVLALLVLALVVFAAPKKCNNGIDDDNDGLIDYPADPGCSSTSDNSETSSSLICDDGVDQTNDRDTLADYRLSGGDPGCTSPTDGDERDGACDDLDDETDDRDTLTDSTDPGCTSTNDPSEIDGMCDDIVDDVSDADSLGDASDPGCTSFGDPSEIDGQCDDLSDNDGDTFIDYPDDPGCTSFSDSSELGTVQCDNNIDDDLDIFIDYPDDSGCASPSDNLESTDSCTDSDGGIVITIAGNTTGQKNNTDYTNYDVCISSTIVKEYFCTGTQSNSTNQNCVTNTTSTCVGGRCIAACEDGLDNDGDGLTDYPSDPGCISASDNSEREAAGAQCDNGVDDSDSEDIIADYPADVGCAGPTDNDERNQCNDATDNDGDGRTDYQGVAPDSKCSSAADNDESPKDSCSDTDAGIVLPIQGTASGDNEDVPYSFTDVCLDAIVLREFYCGGVSQDYSPLNTTTNCTGNFTSCSSGACV